MNDSIDRQKAIATADSMLQKCDGDINDYHDLMVEALAVLPPAEPERKTGMWIHDTHYGLCLPEHYCSECGNWECSDAESNYCPTCGADMRGKQDE